MAPSTQIVIRPADLRRVANDMTADGHRIRALIRRIGTTTGSVYLNGRDPALSATAFRSNVSIIEATLRQTAEAMDVDGNLMERTAEDALAGDAVGSVGSATRIDELSAVIGSWAGNGNVAWLADLVVERETLLGELAGGGRTKVRAALRHYTMSGASLTELFVAASGGDRSVRDGVGGLLEAGRWDEAQHFDRAAAVAQLMLEDDLAVAPEQLDVFEARAAGGIEVGVAATTARLGLGPLSASELERLVDRMVAHFEPGGGGSGGGLSSGELAWLPFTMRAGLAQQHRSDEAIAGNTIRSGAAVPAFLGGVDANTTRVEVVAEFGRAGLDTMSDNSVLAQQLVDLALAGPTEADLRVHGRIAEALADPRTGLSQPFFTALGVAGTAALPDIVADSTHPGTRVAASTNEAKLDVIGRYGRGLAAAERSGLMGFDVVELFAHNGDHSPAYYFAGGAWFDRDSVVDVATLVLSDHRPNLHGLSDGQVNGLADPRALVLDEVNGHEIDGRVALLDSLARKLGDGYLESILWPPLRIEPHGTGLDRHPVGELLGPLLDLPAARPGLAAAVVDAAARHDNVPRLETADVIQHAILNNTVLIAPEHMAAFGRPVDALSPEVGPQDVVDVMERVFLAGSGGGLLLYADGVVPTVTTFAYESGGLDALTDEYLELNGELVGKIRAAFANARLSEAIDTDRLIENAKLYGASVATALGGLAFIGTGAAVAVVGGAAMNVGAGHVSNVWDAGNVEQVLTRIVEEEDGQSSGYRRQVADTLEELGSFPAVTPAMVDGFTGTVVVRRNGKAIGTVGTWQDRIASIESRSHDHTDRYLRRPGG